MNFKILVGCLVLCSIGCVAISSPMDDLNQVCLSVTAKPFNPVTGCECDEGEVYTFHRRTLQGRCETKRRQDTDKMCGSIYGCIVQADLLIDPGSSIPEVGGTAVTVTLESDQQRDQLLATLDNLDSRLRVWHPHSNYYQESLIDFAVGTFPFPESVNVNQLIDALGIKEYLLRQNKVGPNDTPFTGDIGFYSPGIQILPVGSQNCVDSFEQWHRHAKENNIKVHSISRHHFYEKSSAACQDNILGAVRGNEGRDILWVVAAGNDSKRDPVGYGCFNTDVYSNVIYGSCKR